MLFDYNARRFLFLCCVSAHGLLLGACSQNKPGSETLAISWGKAYKQCVVQFSDGTPASFCKVMVFERGKKYAIRETWRVPYGFTNDVGILTKANVAYECMNAPFWELRGRWKGTLYVEDPIGEQESVLNYSRKDQDVAGYFEDDVPPLRVKRITDDAVYMELPAVIKSLEISANLPPEGGQYELDISCDYQEWNYENPGQMWSLDVGAPPLKPPFKVRIPLPYELGHRTEANTEYVLDQLDSLHGNIDISFHNTKDIDYLEIPKPKNDGEMVHINLDKMLREKVGFVVQ